MKRKEVPVGCVIISDGRILGKGYNQIETLRNPAAGWSRGLSKRLSAGDYGDLSSQASEEVLRRSVLSAIFRASVISSILPSMNSARL